MLLSRSEAKRKMQAVRQTSRRRQRQVMKVMVNKVSESQWAIWKGTPTLTMSRWIEPLNNQLPTKVSLVSNRRVRPAGIMAKGRYRAMPARSAPSTAAASVRLSCRTASASGRARGKTKGLTATAMARAMPASNACLRDCVAVSARSRAASMRAMPMMSWWPLAAISVMGSGCQAYRAAQSTFSPSRRSLTMSMAMTARSNSTNVARMSLSLRPTDMAAAKTHWLVG